MVQCSQCGCDLQVNPRQTEVQCNSCGSIFDVVRPHGQTVHGKPGWDLTSIAVGGIFGFIIGAIVFTPYGRSLGKPVVTGAARVVTAAEERAARRIRG